MERLSIADIARLLGISRPRVWQLRKRPDFPTPLGRDGGRDYYSGEAILRWAAAAGRDLTDRAPALYQPVPADQPARFLRALVHQGHVVLRYDTAVGTLGIDYPTREASDFIWLRTLLDETRCETLVKVTEYLDIDGLPVLKAIDIGRGRREYEPQWSDLVRILGSPVPWWPVALRKTEEMVAWQPGQSVVTTAVPDADISVLLRMGHTTTDNAVRDTVLHLAHIIDSRALDYARGDIDQFTEPHHRQQLHIVARPLGTDAPAPTEPPEAARRYAWARLLESTDTLALACARIAREWNSGADFPGSTPTTIDPTDGGPAKEWATRLQPAPARTVAVELLNPDTDATLLIDPATDLPAIGRYDGTLRTVLPQRLPATTKLDQVILAGEQQVWIRTTDGTLYPAPEAPGAGLAWGYRGSGPITLANLLNRLLDDINAPAPAGRDAFATPNHGLLTLTQHKWPPGTALDRQRLLAARADPVS